MSPFDEELFYETDKQDANIQTIESLINNGADINYRRHQTYPLIQLLKHHLLDIAKFLINSGADVNVSDKHHNTPLHTAKSADIAELLIKNGADVNAKNYWDKTHYIVQNHLTLLLF
ncbi:MAG: ankyrin repeat domain-containing protein [Alphaproteobacteria bacterium]|nr:ankyrin repeat domain-containing protein [Alphaproteobacteria bacterium]